MCGSVGGHDACGSQATTKLVGADSHLLPLSGDRVSLDGPAAAATYTCVLPHPLFLFLNGGPGDRTWVTRLAWLLLLPNDPSSSPSPKDLSASHFSGLGLSPV